MSSTKPKKQLPDVIVRSARAGVFAGLLKSRKGQEVELLNARRLWYWNGAATLSQLSVDGVLSPQSCKFPCEVPSVVLTEVVEILPLSQKARDSINQVSIWKA